MKLSDFYYDLPKELIAQEPAEKRDSSRLLLVDREKHVITDHVFGDVPRFLKKGDCLVLNDTRVIPARFFGKRKTGADIEIFLINILGDKISALVKKSSRIWDGEVLELESGYHVKILGKADPGRFVEFDAPLEEILKTGHVPLPPYIERADRPKDAERYQTVYSRNEGATASPTAGLHFTPELLNKIVGEGVRIVYVTLHTSYGTFSPVKSENVEEHKMHYENFHLSDSAASAINDVKYSGGRVIAVGTTSLRVLETSADDTGRVKSGEGRTNLFVYPGFRFKIVDALITNFHLPGSTLLMLVSAFAGREFILEAYKQAIDRRYRFFSYGDAMMIV
ncbi:MAG: tRNA preQ1(34) S-adenosylmethionine ribosyltransferase-isomerase QueA [Candidatus Omnitrophica bacterium]|nr:tRNA preQ1(34) S-adenosylmethionine ribosyltransferase-isomerase QueA [Candidatus Omnitrophota bacterium]